MNSLSWMRKYWHSLFFSPNLAFIISFFFLLCLPMLWCDTHTQFCLPRIGLGMVWWISAILVVTHRAGTVHTWGLAWVSCLSVRQCWSQQWRWAESFHSCMSVVFPLLHSRGTTWRWDSRLSKGKTSWFPMGRRFSGRVSVMGNFVLPREAGRICFHCFCPCRLPVRVAVLISICLVTFCFAIHEDRSDNEKAWNWAHRAI